MSFELERQCTALNRDGQRCGRSPIIGGHVCAMHGGKTPMAVNAARARLLAAVEPALEALHRILRHAPPCEHCGRSDDDKNPVVVRAAVAVLDRCGYGPKMQIELLQGESEMSDLTIDQLAERAAHLSREARRIAAIDVEAYELPEPVLDGEVRIPEGIEAASDGTEAKP